MTSPPATADLKTPARGKPDSGGGVSRDGWPIGPAGQIILAQRTLPVW